MRLFHRTTGLTAFPAVVLSLALFTGPAAAIPDPKQSVSAAKDIVGVGTYTMVGIDAPIRRSEVIARAADWLNRRPALTYNQGGTASDVEGDHRYRRDCSGTVAMAWHLSRQPTTATLPGSGLVREISKSDLRPGDALIVQRGWGYNSGHAVLFHSWESDRSHFSYYSFGSTPMRHVVHSSFSGTISGRPGAAYRAYRYIRIVDDNPAPPPVTRRPYELIGVGDIDSDGHSDLGALQAGVSNGAFWLYPGRGSSVFGTRSLLAYNWDTVREVVGIGSADGDTDPDVLAVSKDTGQLWLYPGRRDHLGPRRLVGSGGWNGMWGLTAMPRTTPDSHQADLFAVETSTGVLWRYPGLEGTFGARERIGGGWNGMTELTGSGDLTGDGWSDLLAVQKDSGQLWLYPGTGTGSLGSRQLMGGGWGAVRSLEGAGDVTGDNVPDLMTIEKSTGVLWLYPGRSTGAFGTRQRMGSGWNG